MAGVVKTDTTVSVTFDTGASGGSSLVIFEGHQGLCNVFEYVCYRVFPSDVTDIRASAGDILRTSQVGTIPKEEFLTFNNSASASLRYPAYGNPLMTLDVYFESDGSQIENAAFGPQDGGSVGLIYDRASNTVVATKPFFGLVKVSYDTDYRVWNYAPEVLVQGSFRQFAADFGINVTYGMLAALYNGSITTFSTQSSDSGQFGAEEYEVYRVVSEGLVNQSGAWEKHTNFPDTTWSDTDAPQGTGAFMTYERVHEVGALRAGWNSIVITQYNVRNERPKFGSANYKPQYSAAFSDGSDTEGTVFENSFATLDIEAIKSDLRSRYNNIEIS